jgi:hypothetical protein
MQAYTKGHVTLRGTIEFPCRLEVNPALLYPHKDSVNGVVVDKHITLLYGLFPTATIDWQKEVEASIKSMIPEKLAIFSQNVRGWVLDKNVAAIVVQSENKIFQQINEKLVKTFPHVDDTYPFNPHCTLFYVHTGAEKQVVDSIKSQLSLFNNRPPIFTSTGIRVKEPSW